MPATGVSTKFRPLNVVTARGSRAEKYFRASAALPAAKAAEPEALAPGIAPTPSHNLRFHGGKTIRDLVFTNCYLGGKQSWKQSDMQHIDTALAAAMGDKNLNNVMMQYFKNLPISSGFKPSRILEGSKPAVFSQGDVEQLVRELFTQGKFSGFDLGSTVFNFLLPSGTVLTTDPAPASAATASARSPVGVERDDSSLQGLGGYHGSVHVSSAAVYYAIGVYSERLPSGTDNGIVAFDQPWKNVVATFYHELNEARTDADVEDAIRAGNDPASVKFLGWVSRQGEECGDFPIFEAGSSLDLVMQEVALAGGKGTVPVQFQYSNAVNGPEGPIAAPHRLKH